MSLVALLYGTHNAKGIQLSQKVYERMKQLFPDSIDPTVPAGVFLDQMYE